MKTIGIYGGTFDPVHNGHLITSMFLREERNLDKIIFVPASISPFKQDKQTVSGKERLTMLRLATQDIPSFEVSDYEIDKGDVSFTFDTLEHLSSPGQKLELIIGFDNIKDFGKWKNPEGILELAQLVVMQRDSAHEKPDNRYSEKAVFAETPRIDISSSMIRERIKTGKDISFLVPDKVKSYIEAKSLYK